MIETVKNARTEQLALPSTSAVPLRPTTATEPGIVLVHAHALDPFLDAALAEYDASTPECPPRCWALVLGRFAGEAMQVKQIRFAGNVRETDDAVLEEFSEVIVPRFGAYYCNSRRGFWCESTELLRIIQEAESEGVEVLGSVHLHPDWHRIGPPHERGLQISQRPTPMDEYMFRNAGWPLNLICYVERRGKDVFHTFAAWAPAPYDRPDQTATALTIRFAVSLHKC
jgi:hypothetical protein